jgi:hypothetical protein
MISNIRFFKPIILLPLSLVLSITAIFLYNSIYNFGLSFNIISEHKAFFFLSLIQIVSMFFLTISTILLVLQNIFVIISNMRWN